MTEASRRENEAATTASGHRVLQRITAAVRSHVDLQRILDTLVADTGRHLDLSLCALARWDTAGERLVFTHEFNPHLSLSPSRSLQGRRYAPGEDPAAVAFEDLLFRQHRTYVSMAVEGRGAAARSAVAAVGAAWAAPASAPAEGECSDRVVPAEAFSAIAPWRRAVSPLVANHSVEGLLVACRPVELPPWNEADVEFLRTASDLAAVAIQHAAVRHRLHVLSSAAAEINSRLELGDLLRRLTESAMLVTQSTMAVAGMREGDEMVCRDLCRHGAWERIDLRFDRRRGLPGWSWTNRVGCIANEAISDPRADAALVRAHGVRNALTVPIVDRDGDVLGFFELYNRAAGSSYDEEDLQIATALAHHAALALELRSR